MKLSGTCGFVDIPNIINTSLLGILYICLGRCCNFKIYKIHIYTCQDPTLLISKYNRGVGVATLGWIKEAEKKRNFCVGYRVR